MGAAASAYFENVFKVDPLLDPSPITEFFGAVVSDESNDNTTKKDTSVMIRVYHSRPRFLSCMYIHDKFISR